MWANFSSSFTVKDGLVVMDRMDLTADGVQLHAMGTIDPAKFPSATYQVTAQVQLPRTRPSSMRTTPSAWMATAYSQARCGNTRAAMR